MAETIYNIKAEKKESCWNCKHFQRYQEDYDSQGQILCAGECRAESPAGVMYTEIGGSGGYAEFQFPVIENPTLKWCGKWERTTLTVPADPDPFSNCSGYDDIRDIWEAYNDDPWTVQTGKNVSCWFCDHFQPFSRDDQTGEVTTCVGSCRRRNPWMFGEISGAVVPDGYLNFDFFFIGYSPIIWCSMFERTTTPIPNDPPECPVTPPPNVLLQMAKQTNNAAMVEVLTEKIKKKELRKKDLEEPTDPPKDPPKKDAKAKK